MRQDWMKTALLESSCSPPGSSGSGGSSRAGGRRRAGRQHCRFFTKREGFELLPNVWWQAVARKSESLGKSSHKDQQQKARGGKEGMAKSISGTSLFPAECHRRRRVYS